MSVGSITAVSASGASGVDLDTFYDNFDDSSIDGYLWNSGSFKGSDSQVTVSESGGGLTITPLTGQSGLHYNGISSSRTYDLTQETVFVEVVESTRGQADTSLSFGANDNSKVIMETESGSLYMRLVINGSDVGTLATSYNSTNHRWWRIRHESSNDTIRFDTSADGIVWVQRHSIARGALALSGGRVDLSAGTYNAQSDPGQAVFDNLSWHPLVPNQGDWSPPATALSPSSSAGTWDHILYGAASPSTTVKFNGTYFLYYIGAEGDSPAPEYNPIRRSLGVATSSDGLNFTKYAGNPIITYTTTNGSVIEEGVGSATAIVVGNTIHLYYAAIRSTGGELVDLDIRYRKSTDGYNFTNDTLIYRSSGDEYAPLGVTLDGGVWSVYIKGPLNKGLGQLSRLSGTSPTSLPNKTSVSAIPFGSGGNMDAVNSSAYVMHLDRRDPNLDRFDVRVIRKNVPDQLSEPIFSYTFGNFGDHATPATFKDGDTGRWFMYTLDLSQSPAVISVRTYFPSPVSSPTNTPSATATGFPTGTPPPTATSPVPTATSPATVTPLPSATATNGQSNGVHIGNLEGTTDTIGRRHWRATVTIFVHDSNHNPVANATIEGTWSSGYSGTDSCVTDSSGSCSIATRRLDGSNNAVTFTVSNVPHPSLAYLSASNHDTDNDSNGLSLTIPKP
jgi:hypothetical protein